MSRGALKNPDRRRAVERIEIPPRVRLLAEPGTEAYRMGACSILLSRQAIGWHLSVAHPSRLPTWEEARDARYALIPDEVTMALLLPPKADYVNAHEFCLQMYEVPAEYLARKDTL